MHHAMGTYWIKNGRQYTTGGMHTHLISRSGLVLGIGSSLAFLSPPSFATASVGQ